MKLQLWALLLACLPLHSIAEVTAVSADGFSVSHTVSTAAGPERSWTAMTGQIDRWWDPAHSWSADAANLYIQPGIGGCFCERLPGSAGPGGVEHLRIIYFQPRREIRFDGALGPLQTMNLQGRMLWQIEAAEGGSTITFTYMVNGALEGGFEALAPAVDSVISLQLDRLAAFLAEN